MTIASLSRRGPAAMLVVALATAAVSAVPAIAVEDVTCAAPGGPSPATMPGGDAALASSQPGPVPAAAPGRCWLAESGVLILAPAGVAVADVVVAANDMGEAVAVDAADGMEAWRHPVAEPGMGQVHGLAVDDAAVYIAGPEGVAAVAPSDGSLLWQHGVETEGMMADLSGGFTPTAIAGTVYVITATTLDNATWERALVALDAATGAERWSAALGEALPGVPSSDGTIAVIAPGDGTLAAFASEDGSPVWTAAADILGAAPATRPAIGGGMVFVGLIDGSVVALDAATGAEAWRGASDTGSVASVSLAGPTLLLNGVTTLSALDGATGTPVWTSPLQASAPPFPFVSIPAVVDDTVVAGTTDAMDVAHVIAFDLASGEERWRVDTGAYGAVFSPLVTGGRIHAPLYDLVGTSGLLSLGLPS